MQARDLNSLIPLHPNVQEYIFALLKDVAKYNSLDGIILDRGRFDDIQSDFSDLTTRVRKIFRRN